MRLDNLKQVLTRLENNEGYLLSALLVLAGISAYIIMDKIMLTATLNIILITALACTYCIFYGCFEAVRKCLRDKKRKKTQKMHGKLHEVLGGLIALLKILQHLIILMTL